MLSTVDSFFLLGAGVPLFYVALFVSVNMSKKIFGIAFGYFR